MFDGVMAAVAASTTPGRLRRQSAIIVALVLFTAVASIWVAQNIRDAAQTLGRDAEPSVALAYRMEAALADMDAAALADSLDNNGAAIGTSSAFHAGSARLADDLVEASKNITYGAAEQEPLQQLGRALVMYHEAVVSARFIGAGDPWITARRVEWASRVNREFAMPQARALAEANNTVLEERYDDYRRTSLAYGAIGLAGFVFLVLYLVSVQSWMAQRMRRIVNPPLAAATLIAAIGGLWFGSVVLQERETLRAAKDDAYDSLSVLFRAKSVASVLRADVSFWLLSADRRNEQERRIDADEIELVGVAWPDEMPIPRLTQALNREREGDAVGAAQAVSGLKGLLGKELGNITYGLPERQAATDSVLRLMDAERVIAQVQALELGRGPAARVDHVAAVGRWVSNAPGGGGAAFIAMQAALDRTIDVNQQAFMRQTDNAIQGAGRLPYITTGALALTALLAAGGLWLRLREYR